MGDRLPDKKKSTGVEFIPNLNNRRQSYSQFRATVCKTSLKVALCAIGTRGEVTPYCVIGQELVRLGHTVTLVTEARNTQLVTEEYKLPLKVIVGDTTAGLHEPKYQAGLAAGSLLTVRTMRTDIDSRYRHEDVCASFMAALEGHDIIISGALCMTASFSVAEKLKIAWMPMINGPKLATSEFPLWGIEDFTCGLTCLNKWSYTYAYKHIWNHEKQYINEWRTRVLGLAPITGSRGLMDLIDADPNMPVIVACSSLICGKMRRIPLDYSPQVSLLGFVYPPASHVQQLTLPPALVSFLDDASAKKQPVVYLGFGSMPAPDPARLVRLAIDICGDCSCRAVLVASWTILETPDIKALLEKNSSSLIVVPHAPWSWLFPKMQCIVHHASTSMTGVALRSGVGQVPIPFMLDQPHNARLIHGLGVAPCVVHSSAHLNHKTVSNAITKVLTNWKPKNGQGGIQDKARVFGEIVRKESEGAVQMYVDVIIRRWKAASEGKVKAAESGAAQGGGGAVVVAEAPKSSI